MTNFWTSLKKPIYILAPMDDVTDTVFRQIIQSIGTPDVFFTEFVSADGLCSIGAKTLLRKLKFEEVEQPLVAQIWGVNLENYEKTAKLISEMGFLGIDINMGCPDKKVIKKGGCSALINNPEFAKKAIEVVKRGAPNLPVSVKTRLGFKSIATEEWITFLLKQDIDALTIHGRTVLEMSKVPAHWDEIGKAVEIRNKLGVKTLIIGNGDIKTKEEALEMVKKYKVDGVMVGRGIFQNPYFFAKINSNPPLKSRLQTLLKHAKLFEDTWGKDKNFAILRKFFKSYVHSFPGATDLRMALMETNSSDEVLKLVEPYLVVDHLEPRSFQTLNFV